MMLQIQMLYFGRYYSIEFISVVITENGLRMGLCTC